MTVISEALNQARRQIQPVSDSASLDAQLLLAEVLGRERAYLLAHGDDELTAEQQTHYLTLVQRRAAGEPVAYILGRRAFYDREFVVTPDVLIPRPETELLLELALDDAADRPGCVVVDVGTGSGALAVTLAALRPQARVYAVDISPPALAVARRNATLQGVQVTFLAGDLLAPVIAQHMQVDLIMANLPYIAEADMSYLAVSQYEPHLALAGGPDGLDLVRRLLADVPRVCRPSALVLLEIGADQGPATVKLAQTLKPQQVTLHPDYAGLDRIVRIIV
jgi:release factor glutamine methyltransferase